MGNRLWNWIQKNLYDCLTEVLTTSGVKTRKLLIIGVKHDIVITISKRKRRVSALDSFSNFIVDEM